MRTLLAFAASLFCLPGINTDCLHCQEHNQLRPLREYIDFKITRGGMDKQAVTLDGEVLPNHSFIVVKDTVVHIVVEDWKDQVQQ